MTLINLLSTNQHFNMRPAEVRNQIQAKLDRDARAGRIRRIQAVRCGLETFNRYGLQIEFSHAF